MGYEFQITRVSFSQREDKDIIEITFRAYCFQNECSELVRGPFNIQISANMDFKTQTTENKQTHRQEDEKKTLHILDSLQHASSAAVWNLSRGQKRGLNSALT